MRALVYTAPGRVELEERPRPEPLPGEVEVAIELAGVCGSDISGFLGHSPRRRPPLVLGHELVGYLKDGQRVIANPLISCGGCPASEKRSQHKRNRVTSGRAKGIANRIAPFGLRLFDTSFRRGHRNE